MTTSVDDVVATVLEQIEEKSYADEFEKADKIRLEANQFFKDQAYDVAIELYTMAIEYNPTATLYANRSMAYLKKELYGSALEDSDSAIALDRNFIKAYYRRATANMALGRFKKALGDYATVAGALPNDPDAKRKHEECKKIVKRMAFEKAIAVDHVKSTRLKDINLDSIDVEPGYDGLHIGDHITPEFMKNLLTSFKEQKKLHKKYALYILQNLHKYLEQQPTLVEIDVPEDRKFTICGDIHGQFYDLCNIFEINGVPSETNPYLFNGDFVDRGSFSVETILTLFGYKLLYREHFYLSRGNHESDVMNKMYGFEGEVKQKYGMEMTEFFTEIFCLLPLCHLINKKIFVCHGGLFKDDGVTLEDIKKTNRVRQPPDSGIMCDLLWSDPQDLPGRVSSKRGVGCQFGPDVTDAWCKLNGVEYVVRSHEVKPEGYEIHHNGKCITVFSAPNYCDQMGNKGAFITIQGGNLKPKFTCFDAVQHPSIPPMLYANNLFGFN
ncbi:unnamed protein product [Auanema sp. JU1783]|nr:unnamed protein product [Auanema sp. JU1783]